MKPQKSFEPKPEKREAGKKVNVETLKNKEWLVQSPKISELKKLGAETFFGGMDFKKAFEGKRNIFTCIDGGTAMGECVATMVANGMDWPAKDDEERAEKVADVIVELGPDINKIQIHPHCGGARKCWEDRNRDRAKDLTEEQIEKEVKKMQTDWAKLLKKKLADRGRKVEIEEISAKKMRRPEEYHNEGAVYYDTIGNFNPAFLDNTLQGFVVKRWGSKKYEADAEKNACNELDLACKIALGDDGFGKRFNEEAPFTVVVLAKKEELEKYKEEAVKTLKAKFEKDFEAGRIRVDGLVVEV